MINNVVGYVKHGSCVLRGRRPAHFKLVAAVARITPTRRSLAALRSNHSPHRLDSTPPWREQCQQLRIPATPKLISTVQTTPKRSQKLVDDLFDCGRLNLWSVVKDPIARSMRLCYKGLLVQY
jgi:hypothetical protein